MPISKQWYTVAEVAAQLGVEDYTVRRWIRSGDLGAVIMNRKQGYRIPDEELRRFLARKSTSAGIARQLLADESAGAP